MNEALVKRSDDYLEPERVQSLVSMSERLAKSRMFPAIKTADEAVAVIQYGKELGLPPVMSLLEISPIQGRLTISGKAMLALFQKSGGRIKVLAWDKKKCEIELSKPSFETMVYSYTWEKAQAEGLVGKTNWNKTPETMLYWRAIANGIRAFDPMVVLGLYTPDEMGDERAEVAAPSFEVKPYEANPGDQPAPMDDPMLDRETEEAPAQPKMTTEEALAQLDGKPLPPPAAKPPKATRKPAPAAAKPAPNVPADPGIKADPITGTPQGRITELIQELEQDYGRVNLLDGCKKRAAELFGAVVTDRFPADLTDPQAEKLVSILNKTLAAEKDKKGGGA